jgi:carboxymethylenebutenolidase
MIERQIPVATGDGLMSTFVCHPERGGPYPVILFFMDAPGIREELRDMARRFATAGYYVMLPNLYYRHGVIELGPLPSPDEPERLAAITGYIEATTIARVMDDTKALISLADSDDAADASVIGTVGYCLSGQFAINAAALFTDRVKAAASIYGTWLLTDKPDSPHLAARVSTAEMYFACAGIDHWMPIEDAERFAQSLVASGVNAEVEFFRSQEHGFAFPSRQAFDKQAAETHWERVQALFRRRLVLSTNSRDGACPV